MNSCVDVGNKTSIMNLLYYTQPSRADSIFVVRVVNSA